MNSNLKAANNLDGQKGGRDQHGVKAIPSTDSTNAKEDGTEGCKEGRSILEAHSKIIAVKDGIARYRALLVSCQVDWLSHWVPS